MRFRLRTLLILVTVACVLLAWFPFAGAMARFHRRESDRIAAEIAINDENGAELIRWAIDVLATDHWDNETIPFGANRDQAGQWRDAVRHRVVADKYERAVFRPWELFRTSTVRVVKPQSNS